MAIIKEMQGTFSSHIILVTLCYMIDFIQVNIRYILLILRSKNIFHTYFQRSTSIIISQKVSFLLTIQIEPNICRENNSQHSIISSCWQKCEGTNLEYLIVPNSTCNFRGFTHHTFLFCYNLKERQSSTCVGQRLTDICISNTLAYGTLGNENVKWRRKLYSSLRDPCLAKTMAAQKF